MATINKIYVKGSYIDIHDNQHVYLSVDKDGVKTRVQDPVTLTVPQAPATDPEPTQEASDPTDQLDISAYTPEQLKASGIRVHPAVVLATMRAMQDQCKQKIDWLSFYSVLLRRGWLDGNVRAYCRLVFLFFGVELDSHALSKDLKKNGTDYTTWTDQDERILRRKHFAQDFDNRLTRYFEQKFASVMADLK